MNAALVPVRSITDAKGRLARRLDAARREQLALAMLADMLAALGAARLVDRICVVSSDRLLLASALAQGAEVIEEGEPSGLNAAVAMAGGRLEAGGVKRLLTIPGDVPLICPQEVDLLFASDPSLHPVVVVPSASGTGTNGLLTSPPTVIGSRFEGASLEAHLGACREAGFEALVVKMDGFELDVDTPRDLESLARGGARGHACLEWLRQWELYQADGQLRGSPS